MELSLITNDTRRAQVAEVAGIHRIFIDLERLGKRARQGGRRLFQSTHVPADVSTMRRALRRAELMVRIDPPHDATPDQVEHVIHAGADYVMLPFFHGVEPAARFVEQVAERAHPVLLVETVEAAAVLPTLARLPGLAEVHIGLNDLSLSLDRQFLFDPVGDGTVARLCATLRAEGLPFGVGGIARLSRHDLPVNPGLVLAYQVCQGATRGWLGRTFRDLPPDRLPDEIRQLRDRIAFWEASDARDRCRMEAALAAQIRLASQAMSG